MQMVKEKRPEPIELAKQAFDRRFGLKRRTPTHVELDDYKLQDPIT